MMQTERFTLENDIRVFCITAESFPDGIMDAFHKVHSLVPTSNKRRNFGISRADKNGNIIYKAALEEISRDETEIAGCETFIIKSGEYESVLIKDFMKDVKSIGDTFRKLITLPEIDPNGYCLEIYLNESDVRCMVPIKK